MKHRTRTFSRNNRGSALLISVLFTMLVFLGVTSYLILVSGEIPQQIKRVDRNRALEIADAGLEHAFWQINDDHLWWDGRCEEFGESDDHEIDSPSGLFDEGERYEVDVDIVGSTATGQPVFFIQSTGYITRAVPMKGSVTTMKTMGVMARPEGFSDFYRFVASGSLSYAAGATLDGKVHTNGDLSVSATEDRPIVFRRKVSVGGQVYGMNSSTHFYDELETNADYVPLPDTTTHYRDMALNGGIYYSPSTSYQRVDLSTISYPPNFNGIVYCTKDLKVSGKPTRPITLVAYDDLYIEDHIPMADDPRHTVGLLARDYVYLDYGTPNNLEINAAIMSINSSWSALGSDSKYGLTIRGSIVTKYGGGAGPYLAGERHYLYDRRLLFYMPPEFPEFPGGAFVLTAWLEAPGETEWRSSGLQPPDLLGLKDGI